MLLFIMNEKRKCLFLAEMEVMFFSLPITFYYTLLYTTGKGVHHNNQKSDTYGVYWYTSRYNLQEVCPS